MKVKNAKSLPMLNRWQRECSTGIANGVDLPEFISVVQTQMAETRDKPQFFTPEKCMQIAQMNRANALRPTNGNGARNTEAQAIAACEICNEAGEFEVYEGEGKDRKFIKWEVCKHPKKEGNQ
jgi:hypothetical protein